MADGLEEPWGLAFLPDGRFLVTERDGRLSLFSADGSEVLARFDDFPGLVAEGQGGLLDVLVPRDVAQSRGGLRQLCQGAGRTIIRHGAGRYRPVA
jgi:aldose sugar dehydrogenase